MAANEPPNQPGIDDESASAMSGGAVGGFKPNIYPIMYWGLVYGAVAGVLLLLLFLLSRFITIVWFPVFLAGLIWGGYRNYRKQKTGWQQSRGVTPQKQSAMTEFREAVGDVMRASQDTLAAQGDEDELQQEVEEQEPPVAPPPAPSQPPATPQA